MTALLRIIVWFFTTYVAVGLAAYMPFLISGVMLGLSFRIVPPSLGELSQMGDGLSVALAFTAAIIVALGLVATVAREAARAWRSWACQTLTWLAWPAVLFVVVMHGGGWLLLALSGDLSLLSTPPSGGA